MSEFLQRIASLPLEKRILLEQQLLARRGNNNHLHITRRADSGPAPLSFGQERLWFLAQLYPDQTTYNEASAYRFVGPLDVQALQAALNEIVQRHEILRTTYHSLGDRPVQIVGQPREVPLPIVDLTAVAEDERVAKAQQRFAEVIDVPFDLIVDLILRCYLYRLDSNDHILLVVRHHIASDGWSGRLFWNELQKLYAAVAGGPPANLPPLPIQYADYATWQHEWLQGEQLESQLEYWRRQLTDLPPLQLPTDRRRPEMLSFRGAGERFTLDPVLVGQLQRLAQQEATTLHTLLMAAYAVLLSRTTAQNDIAIGMPVAGRIRTELEPLIGFFVNTLVIRAQLKENLSFRALLKDMHRTTLDALDHQAVPFEKLVEALEPERHLNRSPFIATTFQFFSLPRAAFDLPQFMVETLDVPNLHAKFDMECSMVVNPSGISGHWRYATDLFDAITIRRFISRYQTLLAAIIDDPDCAIEQLPLLTEPERRQVLSEWNIALPTPAPAADLAHKLFEAQAAQKPHALALIADEQHLTYAELNQKANQVAYHLQELGIGPEKTVGLFLDRTAEMVIGLLGILKSGAAFVPLDPEAPSPRLITLAEDAGLHLVLTSRAYRPKWPEAGLPVLSLDEDLEPGCPEAPDPQVPVTPANAAYVLYTSGSTGQPKGVVVEHRQLLSYVSAAVQQYGMAVGGSFAMLQPLTVDSCQTMIFPALGWGGTLHLLRHEQALDPAGLSAYYKRHPIDYLKIAPSHLRALLVGTEPQALLPRRVLIIGGEAFPWDLAERLLDFQPPCAIWNHYGPTETTVGVLTYPVIPSDIDHRAVTASVPLGHPLPGVQIFILDAHGRPSPIGVPGELCIAGPFLARGYLNRPQQTAAQFPEADDLEAIGGRIYRTGDLARWLADGVVEFLGRDDGQVKIRGFRVELGEIESLLGNFPGVDERCVLLREDITGQPQLVAYLTPLGVGHLALQELDTYLRARLPEVMVPEAYVVLESLPRTEHGKIDRQALRPPDSSARLFSPFKANPRFPEEEEIAAIWRELLYLDQVGIHESFFELGGHSLLAIRVVSRIAALFNIDIPVRVLFEKPTIAELAAYIIDQRQFAGGHAMPQPEAIVHDPDLLEAPLSSAQKRLWFLSQLEPDNRSYNMSRTFRLRGYLDMTALERSLRALSERHTILRTTVKMVQGIPQQVILPVSELPGLELINFYPIPANERESKIEEALTEFVRRPFDFAVEPMLRCLLLATAEDEHILAFSIHHMATDHWSWTILLRDFARLYEAFIANQPASLPDLPIQYIDYAVWHQRQLQGERVQGQLDYWRNNLQGVEPVELPSDRQRTLTTTFHGGDYRFTLPGELLTALHALAGHEKASLFMILQAAVYLLLQRYTGQDDITVGTLIANRRRPEIEELTGLFLNTLVLRADLSGDPSFRNFLNQVRLNTLNAYDHQDVPFELVLDALQPARELGRSPLFQVLLILQNVPHGSLELSGLEIESMRPASNHTELDISLTFSEMNGELNCRIRYRTSLFDAGTIRGLAAHFQTLLESLVASPDQPLSSLSMLPDVEQKMVLDTWNQTVCEYDDFPDLLSQFYRQVAARPDGTAFLDKTGSLIYSELNERSNRLAHYLLSQGVTTGMRIGLFLSRSLDVPVALLSIFKLGGVYVPLDPSYPAERLRFMLDDAGVSAVITKSQWLPLLTSHEVESALGSIFCLDELHDALAGQPSADVKRTLAPDQTAYIIYTSGSTGWPKGVTVPHRQILNRLAWMWQRYPFEPGEVGCQKTALSFVDSLWELFGCLLEGVPTVMIPDEDVRDPHMLVDALATNNVSRIWLVPTLLKVILDTHPDLQTRLPNLRFWVSSGEALSMSLFQRFREAMPGSVLYNLYGTSELWDVTWFDPQEPGANWQGATVPIGRPISNMRAVILDSHGRPVPIGVPGELYVGGIGLADGYINQPALTAKKFTAPPWINSQEKDPTTINRINSVWSPDDTVYRTGDLARWFPDGNIEFLGRVDSQVKLRGYRIELAEIETHINNHPGVRQSVAVVHAPGTESERLIAYYEAHNEEVPSPKELSTFLRGYLPENMIPARFLPLDTLPLTPSGKLDRQSLPDPDYDTTFLAEAHTAPTTLIEHELAAIWADVLELPEVGIHNSFFDLGGNSLLGVKLFARIEKEFGQRLPLSILFSAPTVAQLSEQIERPGLAQQSPTLVPIQAGGSRAPFFCVHGFGGGVLGYADLAALLGPDQPFYGLQAEGLQGNSPVDTTVEAMASRYIIAMREVQPVGPYRIGGYCFGGVVAFEMARQLEAADESVALVAIMEGYAPKRSQRPESTFSLRRWKTVWQNIPYWLGDYWDLGLKSVRLRVRRKSRIWHKHIKRGLGRDVEFDAQDIIADDLSVMPDHHRQLLETHLSAIRNYGPGPISSSVSLFVARGKTVSKAIFGSTDPEHGWGSLAHGGVEVKLVDGGHRNIHLQPHVTSLAAALSEKLRAVDISTVHSG